MAGLIAFARELKIKAGRYLVEGATFMDAGLNSGHFVSGMTKEQSGKLFEAHNEWARLRGRNVKATAIGQEQSYYDHDWAKDPSGGSYLRRISERGRPRIDRDVDDYRASYAAWIEEAFAKHAPGTLVQRDDLNE